jgi:hypothetical protein
MTICSTFLQAPILSADTVAGRYFERTIETVPEDTSVPVIYQGPPRARAKVSAEMAHLVPAVEKLLEYHASDVVPNDVVEAVRRFLSRYGASIQSPTLNVMSGGGIQLLWRSNGAQVEVEFDADGDQIVMVERGDVRAEEFTAAPTELLNEALLIISLH